MIRFPWLLLFALLSLLSMAAQEPLEGPAAELVVKAESYRQALQQELTNLRQRREKLEDRVILFRRMYQEGLVSRLELTQVENQWSADSDTISVKESELGRLADLIAEAQLLASSRPTGEPAIEFYPGKSTWSLDETTALVVFFERSFGRPLPISARGQTEIHANLGLDHRGALDLALHPSSREGKAMMAYLRELDFPYIAFGQAVPGGATGAHIHVGPESVRMR